MSMQARHGWLFGCLTWVMASVAMPASAQRLQDAQTPSDLYGDLFVDVQMHRLFSDGKTFADAIPRAAPSSIMAAYEREQRQNGFDLAAFVQRHFDMPPAPPSVDSGEKKQAGDKALHPPVGRHIASLWSVLARPPTPEGSKQGSLLPLPAPYVVPGGRFREIYYWDSYFTMLGLLQNGRRDFAQGLVDNFAHLIDQYGHVPNGNRSYYLSRSQPPFFHRMVGLLATPAGATAQPQPARLAQAYARYLRQLQREYSYWMDGADTLAPGQAHRHAVAMPDGAILNRYWDDRDTPRDESYREDVLTASTTTRPKEQVYRDLRAGAESGWDYSSRWLADGHTLSTIQTTAVIPVDLNGLMYGLERAIGMGCTWVHDLACAKRYDVLALRRHAAIDRYLWNPQRSVYQDRQWQQGRWLDAVTGAAVVPLFVGVASKAQADGVAAAVREHLLRPNGLVATEVESGQQWDAPNGWAPLQWMAIDGLQRYGHEGLASGVAKRWMRAVDRVYRQSGKLMEKYNAVEDRAGGGGEYPGQDGFGWTNGVMSALLARYPKVLTAQPQQAATAATGSRTEEAPQ